jgi:cation diffusion facilitator CzcD-associated flavoprotein CzcO
VTRSEQPTRSRSGSDTQRTYDAVIVGAGFAGLYMLHRLRGLGLSVHVVEAGGGVGGTWYWNRYPGARCDVESLEYSYQFSEELQQEWEWTERYASQPEILRYLEHVADRFDLRRDIQLDTRVTAARFDETEGRWRIETDSGDAFSAQFCIMATGCLSSANTPDLEGGDGFEGECLHTGRWPHAGVDFTGRRVGVIGTGSSAIQSIPLIAEQAEHLFVFQRTPNYSVPAHNGPLDPAVQARIKAEYPDFRARNREMPAGFGADLPRGEGSALDVSPEERECEFEARWQRGGLSFLGAYEDLLLSAEANETAAEFCRRKIRATVHDPAVAELLCPDQVIGCKRLCVDTDYFATYNRENVTLVDLRTTPIERITRTGLVAGGRDYALDAIVFATGFDAMTGALLAIDIRGRGGHALRDKWAEGPRTYLGLASAGFPNLFTITGPGSPSVLSNMVPSIEQHVNWIADCIAYLREHGLGRIEASTQAEDGWGAVVNEIASATLYPGCNSWYLGANVPGKPRVFMPFIGVPPYVEFCNQVAAKSYEGFQLGA